MASRGLETPSSVSGWARGLVRLLERLRCVPHVRRIHVVSVEDLCSLPTSLPLLRTNLPVSVRKVLLKPPGQEDRLLLLHDPLHVAQRREAEGPGRKPQYRHRRGRRAPQAARVRVAVSVVCPLRLLSGTLSLASRAEGTGQEGLQPRFESGPSGLGLSLGASASHSGFAQRRS